MRRAASTSRTSGRFAVGPAGRSWTSTPIPARHEEAEELERKDQQQELRVDRPRPFELNRRRGDGHSRNTYPPERTRAWLSALALNLTQHQQTARQPTRLIG